MRLIDADKLSNKTCAFGIRKCCSNCGEKRTIKNPYTNQSISCDDIRIDFLRIIDREKTVKAIPIGWIEKWLDKTTGTRDGEDISQLPEQLKFAIGMINLMEMEWEKENERETD